MLDLDSLTNRTAVDHVPRGSVEEQPVEQRGPQRHDEHSARVLGEDNTLHTATH